MLPRSLQLLHLRQLQLQLQRQLQRQPRQLPRSLSSSFTSLCCKKSLTRPTAFRPDPEMSRLTTCYGHTETATAPTGRSWQANFVLRDQGPRPHPLRRDESGPGERSSPDTSRGSRRMDRTATHRATQRMTTARILAAGRVAEQPVEDHTARRIKNSAP